MALLLTVPLVIIAVGVAIALSGGGDSDESIAAETTQTLTEASDQTALATTEPIPADAGADEPTAVALEQPILPAQTDATATEDAPETIEQLEPATPVPDPTNPPEVAKPVPTPTAVQSIPQSSDANPAATQTPQPPASRDITIGCFASGGIPASVEVDEPLPLMTASTTPPDAADSLVFTWNFGNGRTVGSPTSGTFSYSNGGQYTISLSAKNESTGQTYSANCASIQVGVPPAESIEVSCSVSSATPGQAWKDTGPDDPVTVTVSWTPEHPQLDLTILFATGAPIQVLPNTNSGVSATARFPNRGSIFEIRWEYEQAQLSGALSCDAYPLVGSTPAATPSNS